MANNPQQNPNVIFREGSQGETQREKFQKFQRRGLQPPRYIDFDCLRNLGLLESVKQLLENVNLWNICSQPQLTYESLTLEFLSSFQYITPAGSMSQLTGVTTFRMFGVEYRFTQNDIARLLGFSFGEGVHCRLPDNFNEDAFTLWHDITGTRASSYAHLNATQIQNPAIRYFHRTLCNTIFARDSNHKLNSKELLFMNCALTNHQINAAPFLLAHIHAICTRGYQPFYLGGIVTSLALSLNLGANLTDLPSMAPELLTLDHCKSAHLIYERDDGKFNPVIRNVIFRNIILPCRDRIDPQNRANWTFDPAAPEGHIPIHEDQPEAPVDEMQEEMDRTAPVTDIPESSTRQPPSVDITLAQVLRAIHQQTQHSAALERQQKEQYDILLATVIKNQETTNEKLSEVFSELEALRRDVTALTIQDSDSEATPTRRSRTRSRGRGHQ